MRAGHQVEGLEALSADIASMWPAPVHVVPGPGAGPATSATQQFGVFPSLRRPRLVVSGGSRAARAAAFLRFSASAGPSDRAVRLALAAATRAGTLGAAFRPLAVRTVGPDTEVDGAEPLLDHLAGLLGRDVAVALTAGAPRANRKPVLQVIDPAGATVAFAKLAVSPLARRLVAAEAANLQLLASRPLRHVAVPRVLSYDTWNGLPLLVMSALPTPVRRGSPRRRLPAAAMREIASIAGVDAVPLTRSALWASLREVATGHAGETYERFTDLLERVVALAPDPVQMGAWHGDWGPWNMAWSGGQVQLWDWERFSVGVPLGLDALHYRLQPLRVPPAPADVHRIEATARDALAEVGTPPADAQVTLSVYIALIIARYLPDARTKHGHVLERWISGLLDLLTLLTTDRTRRGVAAPRPALDGGPR